MLREENLSKRIFGVIFIFLTFWGSISYGEIGVKELEKTSSFGTVGTIESSFNDPAWLEVGDIDGDGNFDVVGAARAADSIVWWENVNGDGSSWTGHNVSSSFDGAVCAVPVDLDKDGDLDIIGAAMDGGDIFWWENSNGAGTAWTEHEVSSSFSGAHCVSGKDLDGDGDIDIAGAGSYNDEVAWWENTDGSGSSWTYHLISNGFDYSTCVDIGDIDKDGDMDVIAAAQLGDEISWWENTNGNGSSWTKHSVITSFSNPMRARVADIDNDGYLDILGTASDGNEISWFENVSGGGTSWSEHSIDTSFSMPYEAQAYDLDGDGDLDVIGGSLGSDSVAWWENNDGEGLNWTKNTLQTGVVDPACAVCGDLNGDGKLDIIAGAGGSVDDILWWVNTSPSWYSSYDFSSKGVVGYWPLDGDSNDYSGNNLHGSLINTESAEGKFGSCFGFNGITGTGSSRIVLPEHPTVTGYTIGLWVNLDQFPAWSYPSREGIVLFQRRQDYADIYLNLTLEHDYSKQSYVDGQIGFSHLRGSGNPSNSALSESNHTVSTGTWHHLAGTMDANFTRVYLDGQLVSEEISGGALYWGGTYMGTFLGVNGSLPESLYRSTLDGRIDEVAIFDHVLSGEEVLQLASDTNGNNIADFWESGIPSIPSNPTPVEGATEVSISTSLDWDDSIGAETYDVFQAVNSGNTSFSTTNISTTATNAFEVYAKDLDGDGDKDLICAQGTEVVWYENEDGNGSYGTKKVITSSANGARSVYADDIDGDGDIDVLSASIYDDRTAWYENTDGKGTFGSQQIITSGGDCWSVRTGDFDGDGDIDVLTAKENGDKIVWNKNDGSGSFGTDQTISLVANGVLSIFPADLDGDGDLDILEAVYHTDTIAWFENSDGQGTFSSPKTLTTTCDQASSVYSCDIDGDGDLDVLSASMGDNEIDWFENTDGNGTFGSPQVITTSAVYARSVFAADLDNDGDLDVLSASNDDDKICWYENTDGNGTFGTQNIISSSADGALSVFASDIDDDGDMDVLSASQYDNKVALYKNQTCSMITLATGLTASEYSFTENLEYDTEYLWKVVARNSEGSAYGPVWSFQTESVPGPIDFTWRKISPAPSWTARSNGQYCIFNGYLWAMGGNDGQSTSNSYTDVWRTSDGVNWSQVSNNYPFGYEKVLVLNGKMYAMGGFDGTSFLNDVYSSSDGVTWTLETSDPGWSNRYDFAATVHDGKMWVMGGNTGYGDQEVNDVWYSSNGVNWTNANASGHWSARYHHEALTYNGKIWVMGGAPTQATRAHDVWSSVDGTTWNMETNTAPWGDRANFMIAVHDNKMWLTGGTLNDVWYSTDGETWTETVDKAEWSTRGSAGLVSFDGGLWLLGGYSPVTNEVWTTLPDGSTPTNTPTKTFTPTLSPTNTNTPTPTKTPTLGNTATYTPTPTSTLTPSFTHTPTSTPTFTFTLPPTFTNTPIPTITISPTPVDYEVETIIFFDSDRMINVLGYEADVVFELRDKISHELAPMVKGYLIDLGTQKPQALKNAYAAWDTTRRKLTLGQTSEAVLEDCAEQANEVASHLKTKLQSIIYNDLSAAPQYFLIVGGDDIFPFYRIADDTFSENRENTYGPLIDKKFAVGAALAQNFYLTDDFYAEDTPNFETDFGRQFYLPEMIPGRIMETPEEILNSVNAFIENNGEIDLTGLGGGNALVAGSDWLRDAAERTSETFESDNLLVEDAFTTDPSSPDQLFQAMNEVFGFPFQLHFLGLQSDHTATYLSNRSQTKILAQEFQSQLDAEKMNGDLVYHLGSHSGLYIPAGYAIDGVTNGDLDHPQVFLGKGCLGFISQTCFAGSSENITEFSEGIAIRFWEELLLSTEENTIGLALKEAKKRYLLESYQGRVLSVEDLIINTEEDQKTLLGTILFGFPMTKVISSNAGEMDSKTKIFGKSDFENISKTKNYLGTDLSLLTFGQNVKLVTSPLGNFYSIAGESRSNSNEPVMPYLSGELTLSSNFITRGTVFLEGEFEVISEFNPVIEKSHWKQGEEESEEGSLSDAAKEVWFPPLPFSVNTIKKNELYSINSNTQKLSWIFGQYNDLKRDFRLYNTIRTRSFWVTVNSALETDPPEIISLVPQYQDGILTVDLKSSDALGEAYLTYTDGVSTWNSFKFNQVSGTSWNVSLSLDSPIEYIIQTGG